jgi:hypothetical protein
MKGKVNMSNVAAAVAAGGLYQAAIEAASRRVDFVAENYNAVRTGGAVLLGYTMLHFGKSESMKAVGYGLLGAGGGSLASLVSYQLTQGGDSSPAADPVQGMKRRLTKPGRGSERGARIVRAIRQKRSGPPPRLMNPNRLPMEKLVGRQPMMVSDRGENWLAEFSEANY